MYPYFRDGRIVNVMWLLTSRVNQMLGPKDPGTLRPDLAIVVATCRLHMSNNTATTHVTQWTASNTDIKHDREQGAWRRS
jgi:hypothetical protein